MPLYGGIDHMQTQ